MKATCRLSFSRSLKYSLTSTLCPRVQAVHGAEWGAQEPDGAGDGLRGVQVDQHQGGGAGEDPRHLPQGYAGGHLCPSQQVHHLGSLLNRPSRVPAWVGGLLRSGTLGSGCVLALTHYLGRSSTLFDMGSGYSVHVWANVDFQTYWEYSWCCRTNLEHIPNFADGISHITKKHKIF